MKKSHVRLCLFFWYLVKHDLSSVHCCTVAYTCVTFTRCQNNTAMFIWSGCITACLCRARDHLQYGGSISGAEPGLLRREGLQVNGLLRREGLQVNGLLRREGLQVNGLLRREGLQVNVLPLLFRHFLFSFQYSTFVLVFFLSLTSLGVLFFYCHCIHFLSLGPQLFLGDGFF